MLSSVARTHRYSELNACNTSYLAIQPKPVKMLTSKSTNYKYRPLNLGFLFVWNFFLRFSTAIFYSIQTLVHSYSSLHYLPTNRIVHVPAPSRDV